MTKLISDDFKNGKSTIRDLKDLLDKQLQQLAARGSDAAMTILVERAAGKRDAA